MTKVTIWLSNKQKIITNNHESVSERIFYDGGYKLLIKQINFTKI